MMYTMSKGAKVCRDCKRKYPNDDDYRQLLVDYDNRPAGDDGVVTAGTVQVLP